MPLVKEKPFVGCGIAASNRQSANWVESGSGMIVDGPSASGKGTVARQVAEQLGFAFLDSGALYRLVALAAIKRGIAKVQEGTPTLLAFMTSKEIEFSRYPDMRG